MPTVRAKIDLGLGYSDFDGLSAELNSTTVRAAAHFNHIAGAGEDYLTQKCH